jgi:hypothetical protein
VKNRTTVWLEKNTSATPLVENLPIETTIQIVKSFVIEIRVHDYGRTIGLTKDGRHLMSIHAPLDAAPAGEIFRGEDIGNCIL